MGVKFIFKKIRGRIVPIRVTGAISPGPAKSSAKLKKILKLKISSRTSLSAKRISSIKAIRKFKLRQKRFGADVDLIGEGQDVKVFATSKGRVIKASKGIEVLGKRGFLASVLSKFGLVPETFVVKTRRQTFLVQKRATKIDAPPDWRKASISKQKELSLQGRPARRRMIRLADKFLKRGIKPTDITSGVNTGLFKGKAKSIDVGAFTVVNSADFVNKFLGRAAKFKIENPLVKEVLSPWEAFKQKLLKGK